MASQAAIAEKLGLDDQVLSWLLNRIQKKESPVSQNKQYAAEVLAILLQSSQKTRLKLAEKDGVDTLLQLLSVYRRRDPEKDSDEEEYVENLFNCLTCMVDEEEGKAKFIEAEGVELAQIMLREGKLSKKRALRVLDHALSGPGGVVACERLVEIAGLRTVFGMFMRKQDPETVEHLLSIFAAMLRYLPGGSAARIRTLAKFMEKDYEKIEKLMTLRREFAARLQPVEAVIERERQGLDAEEQEAMAAEWLSRRLDAGLFSLQVSYTISPVDSLLVLMLPLFRPSTPFSPGSLPKTMERRRRSQNSWLIAMRTCPLFGPRCKVRSSTSSSACLVADSLL